MRKKIILRLSLLIVSLNLLWSCRNEDFVQADKNPQRNNQDFFKHSKNGGANARAGVDYVDILEAYNREKDFLAQMPDQKGMPIWEKMQVVDAEGATGLIIPLSFNSEELSSLLFVILDSKNKVTGTNNITNTRLEAIVYNADYSKSLREKLMNNFITMDYEVFGNTLFGNIPGDLYIGHKIEDSDRLAYGGNRGDYTGTLIRDDNSKMMVIDATTCTTVYHCTHHGEGSCDHCIKCETTTCTTNSIPIFIDEGTDFPTGNDTPGTGGGGTGIGTGEGPTNPGPGQPKDPCASASVFYRLMPGCGGSGNPDFPELDDPCTKTQNLLANPEVAEKIQILKQKAEVPNANEFGFKVRPDGTTSNLIEGEKKKIDLGDMHGFASFYHSHPGFSGINIFSPPDIQSMFIAIITAGNSSSFKDISFGVIGSEACSTCLGGVKYFHYVIHYNGQFSDAGPIASTDYDMTTMNIDYENRQAEIVETNPDCTDDGSSLNHRGVEKLFFNTLDKMNINKSKTILQRIENDGTVYTITPNGDGTTTATPCI
ncbi:hypothetical protein ASG22_09440 [Chryseobacterium sp. Leaf405]|uniref:hypothetical protein n=1 Tax=Chryseobacterium sp. Leaf405 TaxID=1736367 RepID=UPI0006FD437D|nr:hypothetical protein [Chryseobacterium sp. Leaf405]KQT24229.1 hypothetical protein ASG22_09440 [Chryseobacterium sp. Leaf405]